MAITSFFLGLSILALVQQGLPSPAEARPSKPAADIERLENLYSQSFVTGDARIPDRLLTDDFIGFGSNGKPWDKAAMMAEVRSLPHQTSAKITAITVRVHGDTAIALGRETDVASPAAGASQRQWLDTWRRTAKGWRMAGCAEIQPAR